MPHLFQTAIFPQVSSDVDMLRMEAIDMARVVNTLRMKSKELTRVVNTLSMY